MPIYFIVLKSSMGIFRKSKKVSAFNFDPKGVKKGVPCDPGPVFEQDHHPYCEHHQHVGDVLLLVEAVHLNLFMQCQHLD